MGEGISISNTNTNNYENLIYQNSYYENDSNNSREKLIIIEEVDEIQLEEKPLELIVPQPPVLNRKASFSLSLSLSLPLFDIDATKILSTISLKKTGVEVDTEEKDRQNNKAQLDKVLALFGFHLKEILIGDPHEFRREFKLEKIDGISEKKEEKWERKFLVCTKEDASPIACFKLENRYRRPSLVSNPQGEGKNDGKIEEKFGEKVLLQKRRIDVAKRELKALLEKSGVKLDKTWEETKWNTTREGIETFIKGNLNISHAALIKEFKQKKLQLPSTNLFA